MPQLRAQAAYDTEVAERAIGPKLVRIRPWSADVAQQRVPADGPRAARSARR
jgi:hypothetical protein